MTLTGLILVSEGQWILLFGNHMIIPWSVDWRCLSLAWEKGAESED